MMAMLNGSSAGSVSHAGLNNIESFGNLGTMATRNQNGLTTNDNATPSAN